MNILIAAAVLPVALLCAFIYGSPDTGTTIHEIIPESPFAEAGLLEGDKISILIIF